MRLEKEARRDAREYARAQMYYGEGAGTRRKLIFATVDAKALRDPAYARAFHQELSRQDMAEHATKARHERRRKDTTQAVSRNTKHLISGNYQNVQSGLLIVIVLGYFAHNTGLDKRAMEKGKLMARKLKARCKRDKQHPLHSVN